jgi:NADH:ubiquinone oxidoreductase subunit 5 (subunit L)/multisubunit Na+/H+ antiporter MnhA subunit
MESHLPGAGLPSLPCLAGVFVTAFYSFRMYFLVFHGKSGLTKIRTHTTDIGDAPWPPRHAHHPHESPWVVTVPLVLIGYSICGNWLFDDRSHVVWGLLQGRHLVDNERQCTWQWLSWSMHSMVRCKWRFTP